MSKELRAPEKLTTKEKQIRDFFTNPENIVLIRRNQEHSKEISRFIAEKQRELEIEINRWSISFQPIHHNRD